MEIRDLQIPSTRPGGPAQAEPTRRAGRAGPTGPADGARSDAGDSITISPEARQAVVLDGLVRQVLRLPDTRPDVVAAARAALESGKLDSREAIDATADAILEAR